MARPTLQNGDIFGDSLANAAGYPILDGSDEYGHGPKVVNDWLDDGPNQIKSQFYGFYNRVKLSVGTGLTINYSGAPILKSDGTLVTLSPGQVFIPDNATTFIFINTNGQVAQANALPKEGIPLGVVITSGGNVNQLQDLRVQVIEQVRPISLPAASSPFLPGDFKSTFRAELEPGWLWCDGARYSNADYPDLVAAIGTSYRQPGDPAGTFRVPDLRGRTPVGAGQGTGLTNRTLGSVFGLEQVTLVTNQMPAHTHTINDPGHSHTINDPGHNHTISDPGHSHQVFDPGHGHFTQFPMGGVGSDVGTVFTNNSPQNGIDFIHSVATQGSGTNISIGASGSNLGINSRNTGVSINSNKSNISMSSTGGSTPVNLMQPSRACNYIIRAI